MIHRCLEISTSDSAPTCIDFAPFARGTWQSEENKYGGRGRGGESGASCVGWGWGEESIGCERGSVEIKDRGCGDKEVGVGDVGREQAGGSD